MSTRNNRHFRTKMSALDAAKRIYESIGTPKAIACYMLLVNQEHKQLVELEVNPLDYNEPADYFLDAQCVKLLSKFSELETGIDTELVAFEKFRESELSCERTNARFEHLDLFLSLDRVDGRVLHSARRKIALILGDVPSYGDLDFRFGPGASIGVRGETSVYNKVTSTFECTRNMLPILGDFLTEFPSLSSEEVKQVDIFEGSELTFVPKNAKTDRPICIEPLLNGLYQKGVGLHLRNRLARWGIDLTDQTVNQKLASEALNLELSTVDFASASDTVSYMVVLDLLPIDWVELLDVARSPRYFAEGDWYEFEKFSSMGNGYTFELESLLFFALASACCEEMGVRYDVGSNLSVYGDDVIIPRSVYDLFSKVCSFCGFTVNTAKSFADGLFYESCGKDYFAGYSVRPFYIKKEVSKLQGIYYVANRTLEFIEQLEALLGSKCRNNLSAVIDSVRDFHGWCVSCAPKNRRHLVPFGTGDCGFSAGFDVAKPLRHRDPKGQNVGWDGYSYTSYKAVTKRRKFEFDEEGSLISFVPLIFAVYYCPVGDPSSYLSSRDGRVEAADIPDPLDNGSGYDVRNHTKFRSSKSFWFGSWPETPACWGTRALGLIDG